MHSRFRRYARCAGTLAVVLLMCGCVLPETMGRAEPTGSKYLFSDEFDGPAGTPPSPQWRFDRGGGGWGNNELQVYSDSPANVSLDGAGHLAISARTDGGTTISSARVTTKGAAEFTAGRAEARIALPAGTGLHPAFWLLGSDVDQVGWPDAGEIDVIETLNHADEFYTGIHGPEQGSPRGQQVSASGPAPFPLAGEFHTYWVERTPGRIATGIDALTLFTATPENLSPGSRWVFDAPFFLLLNVAVGGSWPGPPDATTPNPSTMLVDWVRVRPL